MTTPMVTYYTIDTGSGAAHTAPVYRRVDDGEDVLLLEKWNGTEWIDYPDLLSANGAGGVSIYEVISEAEAQMLGGGAANFFDPNQPRDARGRWSGRNEGGPFAVGGANEQRTLSEEIAKHGAFTVHPGNAKTPPDGWMVSIPGAEESGVKSHFTPQVIAEYVAKHRHELMQPNHYLGAWYNSETDRVYLDVSERRPGLNEADKQAAMKLGRERNQFGIFNMKTKEYVETAVDQTKHAEAPPQKAGKTKMHVTFLDPHDIVGAYDAVMGMIERAKLEKK